VVYPESCIIQNTPEKGKNGVLTDERGPTLPLSKPTDAPLHVVLDARRQVVRNGPVISTFEKGGGGARPHENV